MLDHPSTSFAKAGRLYITVGLCMAGGGSTPILTLPLCMCRMAYTMGERKNDTPRGIDNGRHRIHESVDRRPG
jgi:hypothetical protein